MCHTWILFNLKQTAEYYCCCLFSLSI
jgi:hypothetical protein